jgi:hypothetical protein
MSSIPVYVGKWHDYSRHSNILGIVVTLDVKWGGYLIAALSTFVGFVGTATWAIVAFSIHQSRARTGKADLLFAQQQVVYRNQGSQLSAALDIFKLFLAWEQPKKRPARVEHLKRRSLWLLLPPIVVFAAFTVAGLFVANVAGATYRSNDVKIASGLCGFSQYNTSTTQTSAAGQSKISNDTQAGRAYSKTCYESNAPLAECGLYPVQALPIQTSRVPCPFGDDPTGHTLCRFGSNEALLFDTGLLDSSLILGINAPLQDRVRARKMVTCSPIYIKNYYNVSSNPNGDTIETYYLGPILDLQVPTVYTWFYNQAAAGDYVSYQDTSFYASTGVWEPVSALQVATGDVSVHFIAQNSVKYITPVNDLIFAAHQKFEIDEGALKYLYTPDQYVNAVGCIDQYQICNPSSDCTIEGTFSQLVAGVQEINLNVQQQAAVERIAIALAKVTTYTTVNSLSTAALLAQDTVHELVSTGLPSNQWQIEVHGWVATSLSKLQAYILEFAANADPGPYGIVSLPGSINGPVNLALEAMCSQQRIRNTGGYQTFSFLGLMITICVGSAIILTSLILEPIYRYRHKHWPTVSSDYCEVARIADHTLQLQRMALLGAGYDKGWDSETLLDNMPVTEPGTLFPLPCRQNPEEKDYHYVVAEPLLPSPEGKLEVHAHQGNIAPLPQERFSIGNDTSNGRPDLPGGTGSQQPLKTEYMRDSGGETSGWERRSSVSSFEGR